RPRRHGARDRPMRLRRSRGGRRRAGQRVGHAVPPGEVRRQRLAAALQLRGAVLVVTAFDLYPAIDVRGGRVVRLHQGDFDQETVYDDDPVAVARSFEAAGAPWIHVVDLDAARRTGSNRDTVVAVAE